ncbi:Fe-S cluster protein [Candidatus Pacearchaeota archaeon]|nr:Fe-S cluster protein [Candidatus Pacearchaeota archaeon]|tara:strand:+ start:3016 stop:3378 length:363 start_codon:yes stop_codon:yes gene_type:complete
MTHQLYREHILDLWKNPRNFGDLTNATHQHKELNTLCGDEIEIQLEIKNNKANQVKFKGHGCAISIASTSLLTEMIKEKSLNEISKLTNEDLLKELQIEISPARLKCALISLDALKGALK